LLAERFEARLRAPAVDVRRQPAALAAHDREGDERAGPAFFHRELEDALLVGLGVFVPRRRTLEGEHRTDTVERRVAGPRGGLGRAGHRTAAAHAGTRGADEVDQLDLEP